jgi:hypothetical protein
MNARTCQRLKADRIRISKVLCEKQWRYSCAKQGVLTDREVRIIQLFIKEHYIEMYELWKTDSDKGFYEGTDICRMRCCPSLKMK